MINEAQWRPRLAFPGSQALSKPHIPTGPSTGSTTNRTPVRRSAKTVASLDEGRHAGPRTRRRVPGRTGHGTRSTAAATVGRWPNLLIGGRGTHPPWGKSRYATADPTPSPTAHLAGRTGRFEVRGVPAVIPPIGASARGRAQPRARSRRGGRASGVSMALVTTLLPTIARRGGLEPIGLAALAAAPFVANLLGRVRRTGRATLAAAARDHPRRRRGIAARPGGAGRRADPHRRVDRLLAQPVARRPVPPPAVGLDVPGAGPGPCRRVHRLGTRGRGRCRGARRRHPGRPVRRRDGRGAGRPRRSRLRARLRRPAGAERRAPGDVLGARVPPGAARAAGPVADRASPRASTAAA